MKQVLSGNGSVASLFTGFQAPLGHIQYQMQYELRLLESGYSHRREAPLEKSAQRQGRRYQIMP